MELRGEMPKDIGVTWRRGTEEEEVNQALMLWARSLYIENGGDKFLTPFSPVGDIESDDGNAFTNDIMYFFHILH